VVVQGLEVHRDVAAEDVAVEDVAVEDVAEKDVAVEDVAEKGVAVEEDSSSKRHSDIKEP